MINLTEHATPKLNTVHHCRAEAMLSALDTGSIDLIVTSPPYDNLRTYNGFSWNFEYIARQSYRVLKPGGVLVWVVGDQTLDGSETLSCVRQQLYFADQCGFKMWDTMIWRKFLPGDYGKRYCQSFEFMYVFSKGTVNTWHPVMRRNKSAGKAAKGSQRSGYITQNGYVQTERNWTVKEFGVMENVWDIPPAQSDVNHPAPFPEALAERHILTWSNPGDVVLDYFGGSGTTAKEARKNGRNWITNDISLEYCQLMERRLSMPFTPSYLPALESA